MRWGGGIKCRSVSKKTLQLLLVNVGKPVANWAGVLLSLSLIDESWGEIVMRTWEDVLA